MSTHFSSRLGDAALHARIAEFYDRSSALWEHVWGEHMHHGYYGPDGRASVERRQAQGDLVERLLAWSGISKASRILDAGCGIGGSSFLLASRFGASVEGITLSPVQACRAAELATARGLASQASFRVADALAPPFDDGSFDLVWSLESGEHFSNKRAFFDAAFRLLTPGGTLVFATWCHRPVPPALRWFERRVLERIYSAYHLPYVLPLPAYGRLACEAGFSDVGTEDWSDAVAPFWGHVIRSALRPVHVRELLRAGWGTTRGALVMPWMVGGYRIGLLRFGVLAARKPA